MFAARCRTRGIIAGGVGTPVKASRKAAQFQTVLARSRGGGCQILRTVREINGAGLSQFRLEALKSSLSRDLQFALETPVAGERPDANGFFH